MARISLGTFMKDLIIYGQPYLVYPAAFYCGQDIQPRPRRLPCEHIGITTSDNILLRGFRIDYGISGIEDNDHVFDEFTNVDAEQPSIKQPRATVLMFHGNGMNHSDMLLHAKLFHRCRCNAVMVSYRGFGRSSGKPTERGLQKDAQAMLEYILSDERLSQVPIVIYGLSLGGAVAIDLTSKNTDKINALIVENTFTSIPDIVRTWPIGFLAPFCTQRWNSASKLENIPTTLPILFISGRSDDVVPPMLMDKLWEIAQHRGRSKRKGNKNGSGSMTCKLTRSFSCLNGDFYGEDGKDWVAPTKDKFRKYHEGGHVDTCFQWGYWQRIKSFLEAVTGIEDEEGVRLEAIGGKRDTESSMDALPLKVAVKVPIEELPIN